MRLLADTVVGSINPQMKLHPRPESGMRITTYFIREVSFPAFNRFMFITLM
jgi:hypothetical protein